MSKKISIAFFTLFAWFLVYILCMVRINSMMSEQLVNTNLLAMAFLLASILIYKLFSDITFPEFLTKYFWIIIIACATIPRLVWIFSTDVLPVSDFDLYNNTAIELLSGSVTQKEYIAMFPHVMGYPFVLSFLYKIFGAKIIVAQLFNLACSVGTSISIYYICKGWVNEQIAKTSAIISSIWVSQVFYTTIVSTEALFTFLFCISVLLYTKTRTQEDWRIKTIIFGLMGVIASLSNAVRPLALIFIVAVMIHTFMEGKNTYQALLKKVGFITSMLICFLLVNMVVSLSIEKVIGVKPLNPSFGFTFLEGSNISSNGGWNLEDAEYMSGIYNSKQYTLDEVNKMMVKKATERISEDIPRYMMHYINKNISIWLDDSYGVDWNKAAVEVLGTGNWNGSYEWLFVMLCNAFYQAMLALTLLGIVITLFLKDKSNKTIFFVILLIGFVALHMLTEVQPRYHYAALPFFAICAAYGIQKLQFVFNLSFGSKTNASSI